MVCPTCRYAKSGRPLTAFEDDIKRYKDLQKEVSQEESKADMGFISVDYTGLKADVVGHCLEWQVWKRRCLICSALLLFRLFSSDVIEF